MLKTYEVYFPILQKCVDALIAMLSFYLAYWLRFEFFDGFQWTGHQSLGLKIIIILPILTIYFFHKKDLYLSQRFSSRFYEMASVIQANILVIFSLVFILYFVSPNKISRLAILSYFIISSTNLLMTRLLLRNFLRYLRRKGKNLKHLVFIGSGQKLDEYAQYIQRYKDAGLVIAGWIDSQGMARKRGIKEIKQSLHEIKKHIGIDIVVIDQSSYPLKTIDKYLKNSINETFTLQIIPHVSYNFLGLTIDQVDDIPLINFNSPKLKAQHILLKRLFDFIFSFLGLIALSPFLFLIGLLVKLTSKGPIFYGQERVGLDGQTFKMWKFRSMRTDSEEQSGAVWATRHDTRKTPLGNFLRKSSIDELPQLWNVLVGEMSLVGPRPERPIFVEKFKDEIPAYMIRHKMKAGITGLAQVEGLRGNTSLRKRIKKDLLYIRKWSLLLDIKIIFLTIFKGFFNKNAY